MKTLGFMLLILTSSLNAKDSHFESMLSSFPNGSPEVLIPYCAPDPLAPVDLFQNDFEKLGFQKVTCPNPWVEKDFYWYVNNTYCTSRFGSTGASCVETDKPKLEARIADADLMKKIENFASKRFVEYKDKLLSDCCGTKSQCRSRFLAVKLKLDPGHEVESSYESDTNPTAAAQNNTIVITRGKLASALNTENVERVLLHELGHACQFAIISEDQEEYKTFTGLDTRCDKNSGSLQLKAALGEEVSKCLRDEIESQMSEIPAEQKGNFCFGKWYREAFADMKFRSEYNTPYHWTNDMSRRTQQKNYASVAKYIRCAFPAEWKQKMCL